MTANRLLESERFRFFDQKPTLPNIREEVVEGLSADPKHLSPKYFYDEVGSKLFEEITRLPEYYLTRTEISILEDNKAKIARAVGEDACLVEYGSGSSTKIRILLENCQPASYVPVDISKDHLLESAQRIHDDYRWLSVFPTCADYSRAFELPAPARGLPIVGFFPGSSIGNFEPSGARAFLAEAARLVGGGGAFLIGVDTKKDPAVLDAAYDDPGGVTRAFNLNLLTHLNATVGTDFDVDGFDHRAGYNEALGRIEMYLVSKRDQRVSVGGRQFRFLRGESIHTENSYKYDPDEFEALADAAGFARQEIWRDARGYFMVLLLRARP